MVGGREREWNLPKKAKELYQSHIIQYVIPDAPPGSILTVSQERVQGFHGVALHPWSFGAVQLICRPREKEETTSWQLSGATFARSRIWQKDFCVIFLEDKISGEGRKRSRKGQGKQLGRLVIWREVQSQPDLPGSSTVSTAPQNYPENERVRLLNSHIDLSLATSCPWDKAGMCRNLQARQFPSAHDNLLESEDVSPHDPTLLAAGDWSSWLGKRHLGRHQPQLLQKPKTLEIGCTDNNIQGAINIIDTS